MRALDDGLGDHDPGIQRALADLEGLIPASYPTAAFVVSPGEEPPGVHLTATVDVEELDVVRGSFIDRLVEIQVEEGLPIYLVLEQPMERVAAGVRSPLGPRPAALSTAVGG